MEKSNSMQVYYLNEKPVLTNNSIYLGGASHYNYRTEGSWRQEALHLLKDELGFTGVVYVPELCDSDLNPFKLTYDLFDRWTSAVTEVCGCIGFFMTRNLSYKIYGFQADLEFAKYLESRPDSLVYGSDLIANSVESLNYAYLKVRLGHRPSSEELEQCPHSLKEVLQEAVEKVNSLEKKESFELPEYLKCVPDSVWTHKKFLTKLDCQTGSQWKMLEKLYETA